MSEVFINGNQIDVEGEIRHTFQLNDIGNINERQTSYTNKFKAPKTPKNVEYYNRLGLVGVVYNTNPNNTEFPFGRPNVTIKEGGIDIVSAGYAVSGETDDYYNTTIYGSERAFWEQIKILTIQDCFPSTVITLNAANFANYINNDDIFIFCCAHYSSDTHCNAERTYYTGYQAVPPYTGLPDPYIELWATGVTPQFFVKDLFQYVFDYLGYEVIHDLLDTDDFSELLMAAGTGMTSINANLGYGDSFDLWYVAPTMPVNTFLSEIMYRYNLAIKVDELNKKVYFKNMDDILTSDQVIDWSDKFSKRIKEVNKLGGYAQKNNLRYAKDDKYNYLSQNDELIGIFYIPNQTIQPETTVVSSKFTKPRLATYTAPPATQYPPAVPDGYALGGFEYYLTTPSIAVRFYDLTEYTKIENGSKNVAKAFEYQMFYRKKYNLSLDYRIMDNSGAIANTITNPHFYTLSIAETSFQVFLQKYYFTFRVLLTQMVVYTVEMRLTPTDIYFFDFFKKVYIEQLGAEFYVNKIKDFRAGEITEVEIVKIPVITTIKHS